MGKKQSNFFFKNNNNNNNIKYYKKNNIKKELKKLKRKPYFKNKNIPIKNIQNTQIKNDKIERKKNSNLINDFTYNLIKTKPQKSIWQKQSILKIKDFYKRFEQEIKYYVKYITLKGENLLKREKTISELKKIINKKYPNWSIKIFGSYSQGLSTIYSDLDFVIFNKEKNTFLTDLDQLILIKKLLYNEKFGYNIILIKARVPIVKVTCKKNGINCDISVNRINGCLAAEIIKKKLNEFNILKPIIILLKVILRKYELNDAHNGGMSSFLLFSIVFYYFQRVIKKTFNKNVFIEKYNFNQWDYDELSNDDICENDIINSIKKNKNYNENNNYENENNNYENENNNYEIENSNYESIDNENYNNENNNNKSIDNENYKNENNNTIQSIHSTNSSSFSNDNNNKNNTNLTYNINYGKFLYGFLKFYSKEFDYLRLGISLRNGGELFYKVERDDMDCCKLLCVENFQDENIDIGHSCSHFFDIVLLFTSILKRIEIAKEKNMNSILGNLI